MENATLLRSDTFEESDESVQSGQQQGQQKEQEPEQHPQEAEDDAAASKSAVTKYRRTLVKKSKKPENKKINISSNKITHWRKFAKILLAEALGVFIIVHFGNAAAMAAVYDDAHTGIFQVAAIWCIAVTIAVATTAPISGAHLNPAISVSLYLLRPNPNFNLVRLMSYIVAQVIGAEMAATINYVMYRGKIEVFEDEHGIVRGSEESVASAMTFGAYYHDPVGTGTAIFVEAFGTAVLAFVVFALTHPKNYTQTNMVYIPPLIGLTVAALVSILAPLTQCGINPARDFGPRIVAYAAGWGSVAFRDWWVYTLGPIVGAPMGAFLADKILYYEEKEKIETDEEDVSDSSGTNNSFIAVEIKSGGYMFQEFQV